MTHDDASNPDEATRERLKAALAKLGETVAEIAQAIEGKKGERCPYRTASDACTYRGGCVNKERIGPRQYHCGGDQKLKWGAADRES